MPFKNREYRLVYRRKWYAKNKDSEIAHVRRRKNKIKQWIKEYKESLKCSLCSDSHPAIIDFHHKIGQKEKSISLMLTDGYSIERIKKEIEKCVVLCANCHRKAHYKNNNI